MYSTILFASTKYHDNLELIKCLNIVETCSIVFKGMFVYIKLHRYSRRDELYQRIIKEAMGEGYKVEK